MSSQKWPSDCGVSTPQRAWLSAFLNKSKETELASSDGVSLKTTPDGTSIEIDQTAFEKVKKMEWCGDYDKSGSYAIGDVVRVDTSYEQTIGGEEYSIEAGTYACVSPVPIYMTDAVFNNLPTYVQHMEVTIRQNTNVCYQPITPEPETLANETTDGVGRYWEKVGGTPELTSSAFEAYMVTGIGYTYLQGKRLTAPEPSETGSTWSTGSTVYEIAKPDDLINLEMSKSVDGTIMSWVPNGGDTQRATITTPDDEVDYAVVCPRYNVGDIIYAARLNTAYFGSSSSSFLKYVDQNNSARSWVRENFV